MYRQPHPGASGAREAGAPGAYESGAAPRPALVGPGGTRPRYGVPAVPAVLLVT